MRTGDLPALVDEYAATHRVTARAPDGRDVIVTPAREPLLRVEERVTVPGEHVTFPTEARLGAVRHARAGLRFGRRLVGLPEIEKAELVFGCVDDITRYQAWNDGSCDRQRWPPRRDEPPEVDDLPPVARVDPIERRHYLGVQLGGSGFLQIAYRYRAVGRLHLDMGAFGTAGAGDASFGLLYDAPVSRRTALYVGAGAGFGLAADEGACGNDPGCVTSTTVGFGYLRVGVALRLGDARRDVIGLDAGLWRGVRSDARVGAGDIEEPLLWPMAGLSYHYAL